MIAELNDLERLEGRTMDGFEYRALTERWSHLRDERMDIEDRVTDLLRERAHRRAFRRRVLVASLRWLLVLLCAVAVGQFVSRVVLP